MAPIVINNERKEGMQLILQGSPYSHQQLLLKEEKDQIKHSY